MSDTKDLIARLRKEAGGNGTWSEAADRLEALTTNAEPTGWVSDSAIKSASVSRERGGPFDIHAWSEAKTFMYATPFFLHPDPRVATLEAKVRELEREVANRNARALEGDKRVAASERLLDTIAELEARQVPPDWVAVPRELPHDDPRIELMRQGLWDATEQRRSGDCDGQRRGEGAQAMLASRSVPLEARVSPQKGRK